MRRWWCATSRSNETLWRLAPRPRLELENRRSVPGFFQGSRTPQTRIAGSRKGDANGNSKQETSPSEGRGSRFDSNSHDGLLVSAGSSARTNCSSGAESYRALVCLARAAAAVPSGHRTLAGSEERNGHCSCRTLCHRRYIGLFLCLGDDKAEAAALATSLRPRVRYLHERSPMVDHVSGHGIRVFRCAWTVRHEAVPEQ